MRPNRSKRLVLVSCTAAAALAAVPVPGGHARSVERAAGPPPAPPSARAAKGALGPGGLAYLPKRLLVGFAPGANARARARLLDGIGARAVGTAGTATVVSLAGLDPEAASARLARRPGVAFATPDYVRAAHDCGDCWQLGPGRAGGGFGTGAAALHRRGRAGQGSVVAILDSGVADVPDLAGRVVSRRTCLRYPAGARCVAGGGIGSAHGTMVASLIAAADDGAGITGVAPAAMIKSWQVDGGGEIASSAIIAALDEVAADPQVGVVNMSFGGPAFSAAEFAAVRRALAAGKTLVASAGNDGSYQPQYPAAYHGVISVGASGPDGAVAAFSSYGKVDLVAPGVCLPVSVPWPARNPVQDTDGCGAQGPHGRGVAVVSGTSFAAPLVTGVLALRRAGTPLRDRLGLAGTAAPASPAACAAPGPCRLGDDDRKRQGHGLVDAAAWDASFAPGAAPYLVVEADPQLARVPALTDVTWRAYLLRSAGPAAAPGAARFSGLVAGTAGFVEAEPGTWLAELRGPAQAVAAPAQAADADADAGGAAVTETVTAAGAAAATAVRLLRRDDQAPGVPFSGRGPWLIRDTLQGGGTGPAATADLDDVRLVRLAAGQTIRVELRGPPRLALGAALFAPGTTDVFGRLDRIVASTGRPDSRGLARMAYTVSSTGDWLLDIYAQGLETDAPASGPYLLLVSVI